MMMNRSAAMALFLPLLLVLLLATGGQAGHHAVPEAPPPKGYEPPVRSSAETGGHDHYQAINIGPCFPSNRDNNNALSRSGNAPSCLKRCTSKGYAGGRCDSLPDGLPGNCFCVVHI